MAFSEYAGPVTGFEDCTDPYGGDITGSPAGHGYGISFGCDAHCTHAIINNYHFKHVHLAQGSTDLRKSIEGLAVIVKECFDLDPFSSCLFVFCNRKRGIRSKSYNGNTTASGYIINGWSPEHSTDLSTRIRNRWISALANCAGCLMADPSSRDMPTHQ